MRELLNIIRALLSNVSFI